MMVLCARNAINLNSALSLDYWQSWKAMKKVNWNHNFFRDTQRKESARIFKRLLLNDHIWITNFIGINFNKYFHIKNVHWFLHPSGTVFGINKAKKKVSVRVFLMFSDTISVIYWTIWIITSSNECSTWNRIKFNRRP